MRDTTLRLRNIEFDWLEYCVSCNIGCCHNMDSSIPKNECIRPGIEKSYMLNVFTNNIIDKLGTDSEINTEKDSNNISYDNRPLECQIFPFDVIDIDGKLEWIRHNTCHATPAFNYERYIDFFERQFSKRWQLEQIKQYTEHNRLNNPEKYVSSNFRRIREVKWPNK